MTQIISSPSQLRGHYAGFVSRAVALVIDLLIITAVQFAVVAVVGLLLNFLGLSALWRSLTSAADVPSPGLRMITRATPFLGGLLFLGLYSAFFWTLIDKTLGQALLGLRVLRTNGQKLTFWRSVTRAVGYFLAALPLFLGFLWVLVDDRRQGWHDKLADTVVVYDWDARLGRQLKEWLVRQQHQLQTPPTSSAESPPTDRETANIIDPAVETQRPPAMEG